jgi:hypothetical protein
MSPHPERRILPPHDAKAVLPVLPRKAAEAIEKYLLGHAAGTVARLGGNGVVDDLGDGVDLRVELPPVTSRLMPCK